jgi:DinB superfamily/Polyketide cyclase / dehydrase and lipid transport
LHYNLKKIVMTKFSFIAVLFANLSSVFAQKINIEKINWPSAYEPSKSKFYVHNEIEVSAKPEVVWSFLIDALKWPSWYEGAKNVSIITLGDTVLNQNSVFKWETMGLKFESSIKQFEPNRLLAWESRKQSIQGFHVWLIVPTVRGCKVITDESQNGWLTFFEKTFQGKKLKKLHDAWLAELKKKSEGNYATISENERIKMQEILKNSMFEFNEAVNRLSESQLNFRPAPGKWTIAECIEHITLAELDFPNILKKEIQKPVNADLRRKIKINDDEIQPKMTSKKWKAKTPERFKPSNKFANAKEAITVFQNQRNKTIAFIDTTKYDLRNRYWKHPLTGKIDLYQTLLLMSAHLERHIAQIETVKKSWDFPTN